MSKLNLFINNELVKHTSLSVTFSIEQLAHTFAATIKKMKVKQPLPIEIKLDNTTIFKGQIDERDRSIDTSANKMSISGRSLSANLIDSRIKINAIYTQNLLQILKQIVPKFGLGAKSDVTKLPLVPEFQLNAESPIPGLSQIAKQQKLMLIERDGNLVIQQPGQFKVTNLKLTEGINLKTINVKESFVDLFYHYEVQGAWDESYAVVKYAGANTCREKIIISDKLQNQESCKLRAEYERDLAIAKGLHVSGTIPGLHSNMTGEELNKLIQVDIPSDEINEQLLIKTITLSETGTTRNTQIEFMRPFHE
ncbi:phage baseplate assembly protein [Hydrogenovibrio marinus]|uniref:Phage tail protein n=1 Tax=Hydrogenovibrio marinus TaxID=28885 RepID=A0A066ZRF5_HYDMR|nr:hypothetical protein [Hydrogenovibrio marinus]KDN94849.1 hypothetical protein EI16_00605 [Hydrogenovibrio marinus]BBN59309.1 tail protein [Hydrogenovibrio marinus]